MSEGQVSADTAGPLPSIRAYASERELCAWIDAWRAEDLGRGQRDVTSELLLDPDRTGKAQLVAREPMRAAGLELLPMIARAYDERIEVQAEIEEGASLRAGEALATVTGPVRSMLVMERVALNALSHLSAVATVTAAYVERVRGTRAGIYDTRKTLPGWRALEKYAVRCGGGRNHRMGLYDAMLVKDNHLAGVEPDQLEAVLREAIERARAIEPPLSFIEVEVDTLEQLRPVLASGCDIVLVDNMGLEEMAEAVSMRDRLAPQVELEAAGQVMLETVRPIAQTGVDRISVGAITHSATYVDIAMDMVA